MKNSIFCNKVNANIRLVFLEYSLEIDIFLCGDTLIFSDKISLLSSSLRDYGNVKFL